MDVQWKDGTLARAVITPRAGLVPPVRYAGQLLDPATDSRIVIAAPTPATSETSATH